MSLFNEYEARTDAGLELGRLIYDAVHSVIMNAIIECGSTRDVEAIALEEIYQICAEIRIRRALTKNSAIEGDLPEDPSK